mmetsp:Transcript_37721/g.67366  ORF Transcript_37721/g.67366 Transcript_37721/m.67366 type:complete len:204 (+) Transcript_37721:1589-2200(+)
MGDAAAPHVLRHCGVVSGGRSEAPGPEDGAGNQVGEGNGAKRAARCCGRGGCSQPAGPVVTHCGCGGGRAADGVPPDPPLHRQRRYDCMDGAGAHETGAVRRPTFSQRGGVLGGGAAPLAPGGAGPEKHSPRRGPLWEMSSGDSCPRARGQSPPSATSGAIPSAPHVPTPTPLVLDPLHLPGPGGPDPLSERTIRWRGSTGHP